MRYALFALAGLVVAACGGGAAEGPPPSGQPWQLTDHAAMLRASSCPNDVPHERALPLQVSVTPLDMAGLQPGTHLFGEAEVVGGWELTSDDPNFGGLSGLDLFASGNLLAVTDEGAFVWINMEDDAPSSAHIAYMGGPDGTLLSGKDNKDAEGVALVDGLALVSFERNHRILAFDLEGCGAAARSAPVASFSARPSGLGGAMRANGGVEALALSSGGDPLLLGIETAHGGQPFGRLDGNGVIDVRSTLDAAGGLSLVGLAALSDTTYALFRDYDPGYGNTIELARIDSAATPANALLTQVKLKPGVPVDNFEGLAVQDLGAGRHRVWMISDNNFSDSQRTLLMAFDLN